MSFCFVDRAGLLSCRSKEEDGFLVVVRNNDISLPARLNKHATLDLLAEERTVSHSQHETTVRPPDPTDR